MTINPRIHRSQVERIVCENNHESLTEQSHANGLEVRNMIKNGFYYADKEGQYGDFTDLPPLQHLLNNRRRLIQTFHNLKPEIKRTFDSVDHFVHVCSQADDKQLIHHGLKQPPKPEPTPAPEAPSELPSETPAEA